jgi:hypothetical protein
MEGISDIRIVGIDEKRPPRIRKEPYIDLIFQLTHKAPVDWCHDFVGSQSNMQYKSTINTEDCLFIETWVRTPDEIAGHLQTLKTLVTECNARYIAKIQAIDRDREGDNDKLQNEAGPQGQLNRIIAGLDFSE